MDSRDETGHQAQEGPILCVNNCGFFGSAATLNMCSKCHKATILKQESVVSIINSSSSTKGKEPSLAAAALALQSANIASKIETSIDPSRMTFGAGMKTKEGPNRCTSCHKRVGLTGFNCRCGDLFCAAHRYSDKHSCPFDYRTSARDAIAKANPIIRAKKLDKI